MLKNKGLQRNSRMLLQVLLSPKVGPLLLLFFVLLYQGGYEFILKSGLSKIDGLEKQIQESQKSLDERKAQQTQQEQWKRDLKDLQVKLIELKANESSNIEAVRESDNIVRLVTEGLKNVNGDPLPSPHNQVRLVTLKQIGRQLVDINADKDKGNEKVMLLRYDFDLTLEGTYAAFGVLLNQLIANPNLIVIRGINLKPLETSLPQTKVLTGTVPSEDKPAESIIPGLPAPPASPAAVTASPKEAFYIPITMVLTFSVYMYAPNEAA